MGNKGIPWTKERRLKFENNPNDGFKGKIPHNKNKTYINEYGLEKAKEINRKQSVSIKEIYKINSNFGMRGKHQTKHMKKTGYFMRIGTHNSVESKYKNSIAQKKLWENPLYREKQTAAILQGLNFRPTSFEKVISDLCIENSLPFIYTGDGQFWINSKNPDFICKENKVVIEVFYSWFKIRDYGSVENYKEYCTQKYNSAGWKVIFIDETEIDYKDLCLEKIRGCL